MPVQDPTGFYTAIGVGMVGAPLLICAVHLAFRAVRLIRHRWQQSQLQTPPEVQTWLRGWIKEGRLRG
jgi:hypothetical protein